ncbi:hypothetical protein CSQ89_21640 [Chitinimonas sp. BJB300]|nr:hypothetical protein CSQ89_21640 [Chitinimonas sp. BJB300]TSJ83838.1 hypothetical protein FG002_020530 [Chitinimonas sp. BJB300]
MEIHPFLQNRKVVDYARSQGIAITAYMPLAYGKVLQDPVLLAIAKQHQVSAAQVALARSVQQGFTVIPSSTQRANLAANRVATNMQLTTADMAAIAARERGERLANLSFAPDWD